VFQEEYTSAKEQHASQSAVYEKEIRRARKEAYKSSSAVIKLQEELKSTRNSLRITQSGFELEKQKVQRRDQDTFNAQYQLAAVQEELDKLQAHLRIVEEEKEALKLSLKDEEVARVAAEGRIALPASQGDEDLFSSPRKARSPLSDDKENAGPVAQRVLESKRLEEQFVRERMRREHAEEMVDFLSLECRFRCCRCQTQRTGHELPIADELAKALECVVESMRAVLGHANGADAGTVEVPGNSLGNGVPEEAKLVVDGRFEVVDVDEDIARGAVPAQEEESDEVERSMTLMADEEATVVPHFPPAVDMQAPLDTTGNVEHEPMEVQSSHTIMGDTTYPQTPLRNSATTHHNAHSIRTVTTTTTIPMHFTPITKPSQHFRPVLSSSEDQAKDEAENIPPLTSTSQPGELPFDRAAALAAIEYRRGRAKSFAAGHATPRKQMLEGVGLAARRDISAPAIGGKLGALGLEKGAESVGRGVAGRRVL
jgi:hypothetical protein